MAKFLKKGHKVRVTVLFRRWEKKTMMEIAKEKLESFTTLGRIASPARLNGVRLSVLIM